ncbi:DNA glycosylase [Hypoxylon sp. EC38]|nr:DNA glycosylase [Hypoxylon sp. EC38]
MAETAVKSEANDTVQRPMALRRSLRNASKKGESILIKQEDPPAKGLRVPARRSKRSRVKEEESENVEPPAKISKPSLSPSNSTRMNTKIHSPRKDSGNHGNGRSSKENNKEADLRAKKLKSYAQFANKSPFPDFPHPTPQECQRAYDILASLHGERQRPQKVVSAPVDRAGCGDSPSVLDALVRTILSQNTSNKNSTRAKLDMDEAYGAGDSEERWDAIAAGGPAKLEKAIARGGLGGVKSRVIIEILRQVKERYGRYSMDHLLGLEASGNDEEAMRELISFRGVGPKTASCVLLFCMGRDSFAVDTHVHRLTGILGWRPATASRDETFAHLDVKIPDSLKYGLHVLFVEHGRKCAECKAGGKNLGRCELRRGFKNRDVVENAEGGIGLLKEEEKEQEADLN